MRVCDLAQGATGVNRCHLTELLAEREGVCLSRSNLRRVLATAGLKSRRGRRQRYPRERMCYPYDAGRGASLETLPLSSLVRTPLIRSPAT